MTALLTIIAVIILVLVTRVGVNVEYGGDGLLVDANIGFFRLNIYPSLINKPAKNNKKAKKAKKVKKNEASKPLQKSGASIKTLLGYLPALKSILNQFRLKLCINDLIIYYMPDGADAYNAALSFGYASAAMGILTRFLESSFNIKKRDFRTFVDFEAQEPEVYVRAKISLAICSLIYLGAFGGVKLLKQYMKNKREAESGNGKTSD